jgi:hypothetical protein
VYASTGYEKVASALFGDVVRHGDERVNVTGSVVAHERAGELEIFRMSVGMNRANKQRSICRELPSHRPWIDDVKMRDVGLLSKTNVEDRRARAGGKPLNRSADSRHKVDVPRRWFAREEMPSAVPVCRTASAHLDKLHLDRAPFVGRHRNEMEDLQLMPPLGQALPWPPDA